MPPARVQAPHEVFPTRGTQPKVDRLAAEVAFRPGRLIARDTRRWFRHITRRWGAAG
jgi:hypothetical protein